jgi:two-component system, response regulator YesN
MGNLKVMIVDDETIVIDDLTSLIDWERHGYAVVACANDGESALETFERVLPDIVFVDIRLPRLDGLEFSRRALALKGDAKIVILSAYKSFEYAQQAIDIGAFCYIVKHTLNKESLLSILGKAREAIRQAMLRTVSVKRQVLLNSLGITRIERGSPLFGVESLPDESKEGYFLAILAHDRPYAVDSRSGILPNEIERIDSAIHAMTLPSGIALVDVVRLDDDALLIVLCPGANLAPAYYGASISAFLRAVLGSGRERRCATYSAAFSERPISVRVMKDRFEALKELMQLSIFSGRECLLCLEKNAARDRGGSDFEDSMHRLTQGALELSPENFLEDTSSLFDRAITMRDRIAFDALYRHSIELLLHSFEEKVRRSREECLAAWRLEWESVSDAQTVKAWILGKFRILMTQENEVDKKYSVLIRRTIDYVHENYARPIGLPDVAERFGLNCTYLGQKFKRETGISFQDCLTQYRIRIAKTYLRDGTMKVFEIAEKVGYKNSQYFCKVFKDATSVTPHEYMESSQ